MGRKPKNYTEREKRQSRNWSAIVYEDSDSYDCETIINRLSYFWDETIKFYYIKHDRDKYTQTDVDLWDLDHPDELCPFFAGDLKKSHYHIVVHTDNPIILGRAAQKFGLTSNFVQEVKNRKQMIQYLIHMNNPEKTQYEIDEVITNDEKIQGWFVQDMSSTEKADCLLNYIIDNPDCSLFGLTMFAINSGVYDELRRAQHLYSSIIKERLQWK